VKLSKRTVAKLGWFIFPVLLGPWVPRRTAAFTVPLFPSAILIHNQRNFIARLAANSPENTVLRMSFSADARAFVQICLFMRSERKKDEICAFRPLGGVDDLLLPEIQRR
jgi:hypothetical protein